MDDKGEKGEKYSPPPLQVDPKWYVRYTAFLGTLPTAEPGVQHSRRIARIPTSNQER